MHIGFLTPEYPHAELTPSGGLGTSIKNLASSLVSRNISVTVFVYGQKQNATFEEQGILFHVIEQKKYPFLGWYRYRKYLQRQLNIEIQREYITVVEAPDWTGITAFIKICCPLVIRLNGTDGYFCKIEGRKQKWKNFFLEKRALNSADALISVSAFTAIKTKEIFNLLEPIVVIPNSIEVKEFFPFEISTAKNRLLYFGTLIRKKGIFELAAIFNEVVRKRPETELLVIGKNVVDILEKKSTLELFENKLSPLARQKLTYLPELNYVEIRKHIAEATVIVLPSFAEALPMTWLEAMAMEKALVTSNIGWAKEVMINGITGFTEDPKCHEAYAEKIIQLLGNPALAEKMGKAARQQVLAKFSTEVVVKQNIKFYREIGIP